MLKVSDNLILVDKLNGNLAFKLYAFDELNRFDHVQRLNYFSLIWIQKGSCTLTSDLSEYQVSSHAMVALAPYQPFMLREGQKVSGLVINFHPDFFCIHKHHAQVACDGVLFNNVYDSPVLPLNDALADRFSALALQMKEEILHGDLAQHELLVSYLKILLVEASRRKIELSGEAPQDTAAGSEPFVLRNLKTHIESNFRTMHAASQYAELLNISTKALGKLTKKHLNKTITNLITERIMVEAKRELFLTDKQVKLIASELGYDDEYYFSRFFKNYAQISPQMYRDTVGFARS